MCLLRIALGSFSYQRGQIRRCMGSEAGGWFKLIPQVPSGVFRVKQAIESAGFRSSVFCVTSNYCYHETRIGGFFPAV